MLSKSSSHLRLTKQICLTRDSAVFPCEYCTLYCLDCFIMTPDPDPKSKPKCNKCTHCGHLCVSVSWESLNQTHLSLQKEISKVNNDLAALSTKVVHLQRTLDQVNNCASEKVDCLAAELDSDNDETENEAPSDLSQFVNFLSPSFWNSIAFPSQNIKASLHSSWGFALVPKLIQRYCILFTWQDSELSH